METELQHLVAIIGAATTVVTALGVFLAAVAKLWKRDNFTDARVSLLWDAYMRRGKVNGLLDGKIIKLPASQGEAMPYALRDDLRQAYNPVMPVLEKIYRDWLAKPGRITFGEAVEKAIIPSCGDQPAMKMSDWLTEYICLKHQVTDLECIAFAEILVSEKVHEPVGA